MPQEPRELDEAYDNRLLRSVLAPFYVRLERMLAGMLTRKPVRLTDVSDNIREQLFDVDLQGNDLNVWTYETARKCVRYGHVGVLVDAPAAGADGRPYWVTYTPRDILGWRVENADGKQNLTQLRLMERVVVPDGLYGEKEVQQVRVLTPGAFEIHQKDAKGDFRVVEEGTTSLSEIPFAVAYSNRTNVLESSPPLADIAELNLKQYQVQSDLDNQLHISAVPMLAFYGFPQAAEEVSAGPGEAIAFPADGRAEYIEPGGRSYEAQFKRLDQIASQINELGLAAVLGQKLSAETAEAKRIDRSQGDSTMMVIAQQMQDLIDNCLGFHAAFLQEQQAGSSFVNRDFLASRLSRKRSKPCCSCTPQAPSLKRHCSTSWKLAKCWVMSLTLKKKLKLLRTVVWLTPLSHANLLLKPCPRAKLRLTMSKCLTDGWLNRSKKRPDEPSRQQRCTTSSQTGRRFLCGDTDHLVFGWCSLWHHRMCD